jgi:hypothetical protein
MAKKTSSRSRANSARKTPRKAGRVRRAAAKKNSARRPRAQTSGPKRSAAAVKSSAQRRARAPAIDAKLEQLKRRGEKLLNKVKASVAASAKNPAFTTESAA